MEITEESRDGAVILRPAGRIDSGTTAAFEAALLRALAGGPVRVVVDLGGAARLSSAGLRALLTAARTAKPARSRILLAAVPAAARPLFADSGFATLFEIHPTVEAALAALR